MKEIEKITGKKRKLHSSPMGRLKWLLTRPGQTNIIFFIFLGKFHPIKNYNTNKYVDNKEKKRLENKKNIQIN
jgi:hypothetical protein